MANETTNPCSPFKEWPKRRLEIGYTGVPKNWSKYTCHICLMKSNYLNKTKMQHTTKYVYLLRATLVHLHRMCHVRNCNHRHNRVRFCYWSKYKICMSTSQGMEDLLMVWSLYWCSCHPVYRISPIHRERIMYSKSWSTPAAPRRSRALDKLLWATIEPTVKCGHFHW
jgi:hypothetical protein